MRNLLDFLNKYSYWLLFILLEAISLLLLFRFNLYQGSVWFTSANTVAGKILEWEADALSYIELGERNQALVQRNYMLERKVEELTRRLDKATHDSTYTEILQAELLKDFRVIPAEVVNNSVNKRNNYLTINKGEADGVKPEDGRDLWHGDSGHRLPDLAPLFCGDAVAQRKVERELPVARNGLFRLSVLGRAQPLYLSLGDIPRHARLKVGMAVETSGFSAVFPAGLFVGRVKEIANSEDGISYKLKVNLGTDFARLRDVCVLATPNRVR